MKFEGKFDAAKLVDHAGSFFHANGHVDSVATHAPSDAIIVSDAHLLFGGDYTRSGVDLIISHDDQRLILEDYFKGEKRAALASPDGAHLNGDIVNALSGHVDYAQADGVASAAKVIGHVTKLVGNATAIRNGVTIILNQGDNVNKGDVLQAGSDSTVGVTFIDGTVFGLSSNARMVLNEMVYDPNGSNNSSLMSLVKGTISFVAGETAKHGDMKIDTPAATMGIRGTAVLVQIDFDIPGQGDVPDAKFQVLVEPDGTTGSYILYDKNTLDPIATVDKAGTQVTISHGVVSQASSGLSSDIQKLITDVFSLKFTSTDANPKTSDHFTDSIIPLSFGPQFAENGYTAIPVFLNLNTQGNQASNPGTTTSPIVHLPIAPDVVATSNAFTEHAGVTGSTALDTVSGTIRFVDQNAGDLPTASASFTSFTYQNAQHTDVTASLTTLQLADIKAVEAQISVVASPGNANTGSATWTYSVEDKAFDFLAAGETLTLTYTVDVSSNYTPLNLQGYTTFTVTVTGTNDTPVITSAPQIGTITELAATQNSPALDTAHGTVTFTDADLTDTHTATIMGVTASGVTTGLTSSHATLLGWLSLGALTDSTNGVTGSDAWSFAAQDKNFDYLAAGETLTLTYVVQIADDNGGTTTQDISVTIVATNDAPVVAIDTSGAGGTGLHAITEKVGLTGSSQADTSAATLTFTDVDLTDTHTVSIGAPTATWTGGALTGLTASDATALNTALDTALSSVLTDSTHTGAGSVALAFSAADNAFDFLAAGETLTVVYEVTVTDNNNATSTQPVTFTITGTNDAPVVTIDTSGAGGTHLHAITEQAGLTGSSQADTSTATLNFTDVDLSDTHTVTLGAPAAIWSVGPLTGLPASDATALNTALDTALSSVLTDSTHTGAGSVALAFSAADNAFDFLADGETLTVTYNVTVTDNHTATSTQPVTFTITGTNDAPVVATDATPLHAILETVGLTGSSQADTSTATLNFTDVDLTDTHTVTLGAPAAIWSVGPLTGLTALDATALNTALDTALSSVLTDSTHTGAGSVALAFSAADNAFDFLAAGETLTVVYEVTVTDNNNATSTQPVTFTITGTNDAPVVTIDTSGAGGTNQHAITEQADLTGSSQADTSTATLNFTDVDLSDTHTVSIGTPTATWTGGALTGLTASDATALNTALDTALSSVLTDSTHTGAGSVALAFSAADNAFDFLADGETLTVTYNVTVTDNHTATSTQPVTFTITGTNDAPVVATDATPLHAILETVGLTGSSQADTSTATLNFTDVDLTDTHTVTLGAPAAIWSVGPLTGLTASDATALNTALDTALSSVLTDSTHTGAGSVALAFSAADNAFDFLADGETLTVTYNVTVTDNNNATSTQPVTFTITGTNDAPVITSAAQTVALAGGVATPGGYLTDNVVTQGTLSFSDVDLTDTHSVSTALTSAGFSGAGILSVTSVPIAPLQIFEAALSVSMANDSQGTGSGTIDWSLAKLPAYLADFIPNGETLTLTYAVTVTDSQSATFAQNLTVTIAGNDTPAVVWIATTTSNSSQGGLWGDSSNWETGVAPTATDDVIITADQLMGFTPSYPVTINAPAFAASVTMNDYGTTPPQLINQSTLTISGAFNLNNDSIVDNSGTISVAGAMEVLNTSTLQNSGLITLAQGGDFKDQSSITNSGTIEVSGGTLSILVALANSVSTNGVVSNGTLLIDQGATLDLQNATITGGKLRGSGTIETAAGNTDSTLDGVTIGGASLVTVSVGTLTLTDTITMNGSAAIDATMGTLDLNNADVIGGALEGPGTIETAAGNADSTLDGVTVGGHSLVTVSAGTLTLSDTITMNGNAQINATMGTLDLNNADVIGGKLEGHGTIETAAGNTGSTLDGVTMGGGSLLMVSAGTLTLTDTITMSGSAAIDATTGTLDLNNADVIGGKLEGHGTIETAAGNTGSTLDGVTMGGGSLLMVSAGTLTLTDTITMSGSAAIDATTGTLDLNNADVIGGKLEGHGTIETAAGNTDSTLDGVTMGGGSLVTVSVDTLTLTDTITMNGNAQIDVTTGMLDLNNADVIGGTLEGHGTIETAASNINSTLDGVTMGGGSLVTVSVDTLTLTDTITMNGNAQIDVTTGMLDLNNADVIGGTLEGHGTIETAASNINSTLDGVTMGGGSLLTVSAGTLALTDTITMNGSAAIDATMGTLDLNNADVIGGKLEGSGTIETAVGNTGSTLDGVTIVNSGILEATVGTLTITAASSLHNTDILEANGGTLVIDTAITGNGSATINAGTLEIGSGVTDAQKVTFSGAGFLQIDTPSDFSGKVAGISAANDVLDLGGFGSDNVTAATGNYHSAANTTTLTVTDHTDSAKSVTVTLVGDYAGSSWSVTGDNHNGVDIVEQPAAHVTIATGAPLELSAPSSEAVVFQGSTGSLTLDAPSSFQGTIFGFSGDGTLNGSDQIDLKGISFASLQDSFNAATGTLSVNDGTDSTMLHFAGGGYVAANFSFAADSNGDTIVYDPPVTAHTTSSTGATAPAASPIVTAANHGFDFNFTNQQSHDSGADFHPPSDANHTGAATLAALSAPHDGGHSNLPPAADIHDAMVQANIIQAQHHADFHFG